MVANAKTTADAIYAIEAEYAPDYDWPILPYPAPVSVAAIVRKPRKKRTYAEKQARTDGIRVVSLDGTVTQATDDTFADVLATVIPHSALEPAPTEVRPLLPESESGFALDVQPSLTIRYDNTIVVKEHKHAPLGQLPLFTREELAEFEATLPSVSDPGLEGRQVDCMHEDVLEHRGY